MAFQTYSAKDAKDDAFARVLLLGPPKLGKTTSLVTTAPRPLVLNCDGDSALKFPADAGAEFEAGDVLNAADYLAACKYAVARAATGEIESIILDSVSVLVDNLTAELESKGLSGREMWGELMATGMRGFRLLLTAQAHLFVVAHYVPTLDTASGVVPGIGGQLKTLIPARMHDWVLFSYEAGRKPERMYLLGPQPGWNASGRNIKRSCAVEATVPALFDELGITL